MINGILEPESADLVDDARVLSDPRRLFAEGVDAVQREFGHGRTLAICRRLADGEPMTPGVPGLWHFPQKPRHPAWGSLLMSFLNEFHFFRKPDPFAGNTFLFNGVAYRLQALQEAPSG